MWESTSTTLSGGGFPITSSETYNFWNQALVEQLELRISAYITELPDNGFRLLKEIPIDITPGNGGGWIARFDMANIAMSGSDPTDAKESLIYDILDTMELFAEEEPSLVPALRRNFNTLRQYIEVAK